MRVAVILVMLVMSACASDPGRELQGRHLKNGAPERYERLGTITSTALPDETACGEKQIKWCGAKSESCQCVYAHEARDRLRRMTDQLNTARFPNP